MLLLRPSRLAGEALLLIQSTLALQKYVSNLRSCPGNLKDRRALSSPPHHDPHARLARGGVWSALERGCYAAASSVSLGPFPPFIPPLHRCFLVELLYESTNPGASVTPNPQLFAKWICWEMGRFECGFFVFLKVEQPEIEKADIIWAEGSIRRDTLHYQWGNEAVCFGYVSFWISAGFKRNLDRTPQCPRWCQTSPFLNHWTCQSTQTWHL